MDAVRPRSRVAHQERDHRRHRRDLPRARPVAADRRRGVAVRRSGPAVRHHRQRLAHVEELGAHQRVEPVLRVHVPRRQRLQPGVAEPAQVPERRAASFDVEAFKRAVEITILAQEIIVDNAKYPSEKIGANSHAYPSARPRLRQPRRAAHVARPAVRLGSGSRLRRRGHLAHVRPRLRDVGQDRARRHRAVRGLRGQQGAVPRRHGEAPPPRRQDRRARWCRTTS